MTGFLGDPARAAAVAASSGALRGLRPRASSKRDWNWIA
jgi:hypothetical protein